VRARRSRAARLAVQVRAAAASGRGRHADAGRAGAGAGAERAQARVRAPRVNGGDVLGLFPATSCVGEQLQHTRDAGQGTRAARACANGAEVRQLRADPHGG
jgi:hypothetical protein